MKIRIYETGNLDLCTVTEMLCQRDKQSNFIPDSRWIESQSEITTEAFDARLSSKPFILPSLVSTNGK